MSEFLDNQTVTAASLNQIAIDLGKPTFTNFADNTAYNVDKLNDITAAIVGRGIAIGVKNACECTLSDGNITVDTGLIFFNSGAKMRIDTAQTIAYTSSAVKRYIYAYNDTALNSIRLVSDEDAPAENMDTVMLCTVENNVLTDEREYSIAKVTLPAGKTVYQYEKTVPVYKSNKHLIDTIFDNQYSLAAVECYVNGTGYIAKLLVKDTEISWKVSNSMGWIYLKKSNGKIYIYNQNCTTPGTVTIWFI